MDTGAQKSGCMRPQEGATKTGDLKEAGQLIAYWAAVLIQRKWLPFIY